MVSINKHRPENGEYRFFLSRDAKAVLILPKGYERVRTTLPDGEIKTFVEWVMLAVHAFINDPEIEFVVIPQLESVEGEITVVEIRDDMENRNEITD